MGYQSWRLSIVRGQLTGQARKKEALINSAPPSDPAWTAQLEKERQEEIRVISDACEILGRDIFEVGWRPCLLSCVLKDTLPAATVTCSPANSSRSRRTGTACTPPLPISWRRSVWPQPTKYVADTPPDAPRYIASHHHLTCSQSTNPKFTRRTAAQYMLAHPDEFRPFLPSIGGEDAEGATTHDGIMTEKEFKRYCKNVSDTGEWGGEPEVGQRLRRVLPLRITSGDAAFLSLSCFVSISRHTLIFDPGIANSFIAGATVKLMMDGNTDSSPIASVPSSDPRDPARSPDDSLSRRRGRHFRRHSHARAESRGRGESGPDQLSPEDVWTWRGE